MSVVDPGLNPPGGQVRDDSWPFISPTISGDTTEATTEPTTLPELCLCQTPIAVTQLTAVAENPFIVNCRAVLLTADLMSTVLKVIVVGNACGPTEAVAAIGTSTVETYPTPTTPEAVATSCSDLVAATTYSDAYTRANNSSLGASWTEFTETSAPTLGDNLFSISSNNLRSYNDTSAGLGTKGAWYASFPASTTHQYSKLIFSGSSLVSAPVAPLPSSFLVTGGGPAVRMSNQGGGTGWYNNVRCYNLWYQETRSRTAPYTVTQGTLYLDYLDTSGFSNLSSAVITPLVAGDELKLTAMNFTDPSLGARVCIKGYVNDVLKVSKTLTHTQSTYIETGRAGIGGSALGSDLYFAIDWSDWEGAECDFV